MKNDELQYVEDLIRSAAELPRATVGFRRRVMRAARRAEKDRAAERQTRWTLCISGIAALALISLGPFVASRFVGHHAANPVANGAAAGVPQHPTEDWDLVDSYKKDQAVRAGLMRGADEEQ